ncbi:YAP-binding/ALF4/Glomulin [Geopyxis carbonaria]|nr:YAP-binding/ALF4/Glomulin [Geopyxis carbonaria]
MSEAVVTLEKAIDSIKTAADEIPAEEFLSYSTILDVHLTHALEEFSAEDQFELLEAVTEILKTHEDLARDIAWDLVSVLLPFLESPLDKTVKEAESLISSAAAKGNPREVFIKLLEALSQLSWIHQEDVENDDDEAHHSGGEDDAPVPTKKNSDIAALGRHTIKKFHVLVSALGTVHPRITTKFPSRFLSTELSTLLGTFIKTVETVDRDAATEALGLLLGFAKIAHPKLALQRKLTDKGRPPLPPRVSTTDVPKTTDVTKTTDAESESDENSSESLLQARLIASFLSHVLETYLLRTRRQSHALDETDHSGDDDERGLELGWAGKYDEEVLRPGKSKVPGGQTQIDEERAARSGQTGVQEIVDEISEMCKILGVETTELLELVQASADPADEDEDDKEEMTSPRVASDVPMSKHGALFLLAHRLSKNPKLAPALHVFPEHKKISEGFMIYGAGQTQPPVIDAILFLGTLALKNNGLGDVPDEIEPFTIYLQIFAVISTNSNSPQARFLAHYHVSTCLRAHPNEAVRLAYIKDTLEHCPFESLKAAVVGILKDEILHATTPVTHEGASAPSSPISIFGTSLCLTEIFNALFPDIDAIFSGSTEDKAWETFKELYSRLIATVNLYIFLLLGNGIRDRLGVSDDKFSGRVETQFLGPLKKQLDAFGGKTQFEGGTEVGILQTALERVEELKSGL